MRSMTYTFGIIGGTGKHGSALAKRLLGLDYPVRIGSRSSERGKNFASDLGIKLSKSDLISGGSNEYALMADVIALTIPFDQVEPLIGPHLPLLQGKIVLDLTVNLEFGKYIKTHLHEGKSSYEYIREFLPDSRVVACLKTISYSILEGDDKINQVDFQMTTDNDAYQFSSELVMGFGLHPVRVRGKTHAHTIERMVALSIQLNKEYSGSHVGFQLTNLKQ